MAFKSFIDLYHDDTVTDWPAIKAAGFDGVFLKHSQGGSQWEGWALEQADNAKGVGLKVGLYHWLQPGGTLAKLKRSCELVVSNGFEYGQAIDFEPTYKPHTEIDLWDGHDALAECTAALVAAKAALQGRPLTLYTSKSFVDKWAKQAAFTAAQSGVQLWLARYPLKGDPDISKLVGKEPALPKGIPGPAWAWQYTENGVVSGVKDDCDRSVTLTGGKLVLGGDVVVPDPVPPVKIPKTLRLEATGDLVRQLQGLLKIHVDGEFGPDTFKAVKAFQKAHGLEADGAVGKDTWKALLGIA